MSVWNQYHAAKATQPEVKMVAGTFSLSNTPAKTAGKGYSLAYGGADGQYDVTLTAGEGTVLSAVCSLENGNVDTDGTARVLEVVNNVVTFVATDGAVDSDLTSAEFIHFAIFYSTSSLSKV